MPIHHDPEFAGPLASRHKHSLSLAEAHRALPARTTLSTIHPRLAIALVLDTAMLVYALSILLVLLFGGVKFGPLTATTTAKPTLMLLAILPVRVAIRQRTTMVDTAIRVGSVVSRFLIQWPQSVRDVGGSLAATLGATVLVGFVANVLVSPVMERPFSVPEPWSRLAETFMVWDSGWYWEIALHGYYFSPDAPSSIAFFPLYPLVARGLAAPFGGTPAAVLWAGVAASWVSLTGALLLLHRYVEQHTGDAISARRAVLLLAVFPFSFYFSRFYTESLFLLLTVAALFGASRQYWWCAGTAGALAAVTRPNGIVIGIPLLMMAAQGRPGGLEFGRRLIALSPVPLALVGFSVYVYTLSGDPLGWLAAQEHWNYSLDRLPHRHLLRTLSAIESHGLYQELQRSPNAPIEALYTVIALLFLSAVPFVWRRFGAPLAAYVLVSLLIPLSGSTLEGIGRYASVLFPVFMWAGTIRSQRVHDALVIISCLLLALCVVLFVGWHSLH